MVDEFGFPVSGTTNPMGFFFCLIILVLIGVLAYNLSEYVKNSNAPEEIAQAKLIDKFAQASRSRTGNGGVSTSYILTFELETKERKSFTVLRQDYLNYVVGDIGQLSFQRKKFNDFKI